MSDDLDVHIPDSSSIEEALSRTSHLAIGAHPDDLEIIGIEGIGLCADSSDSWFTGITITNGAGAPRAGSYADYDDRQLIEIRREEQRQAADMGKYSCVIQLGLNSDSVTNGLDQSVVTTLANLVRATSAHTVYLHNPFDRHQSHVGCCAIAIQALRALPAEHSLSFVAGVEVWRSLDWLAEKDRVRLELDEHATFVNELLPVFKSQIDGGKRYDRATVARHIANATFDSSHSVDGCTAMSLAVDLLPLIRDRNRSLSDFAQSAIGRFAAELEDSLSRYDQKAP